MYYSARPDDERYYGDFYSESTLCGFVINNVVNSSGPLESVTCHQCRSELENRKLIGPPLPDMLQTVQRIK